MKILNQSRGTELGVGIDTAIVKEVIDVFADWRTDRVTAEPTTRRVGKTPVTASRGRQKPLFEFGLERRCECPRVPLPNDLPISSVEAAPYECSCSGIVVEEALVAKSGVVTIRLLEDVY